MGAREHLFATRDGFSRDHTRRDVRRLAVRPDRYPSEGRLGDGWRLTSPAHDPGHNRSALSVACGPLTSTASSWSRRQH